MSLRPMTVLSLALAAVLAASPVFAAKKSGVARKATTAVGAAAVGAAAGAAARAATTPAATDKGDAKPATANAGAAPAATTPPAAAPAAAPAPAVAQAAPEAAPQPRKRRAMRRAKPAPVCEQVSDPWGDMCTIRKHAEVACSDLDSPTVKKVAARGKRAPVTQSVAPRNPRQECVDAYMRNV